MKSRCMCTRWGGGEVGASGHAEEEMEHVVLGEEGDEGGER